MDQQDAGGEFHAAQKITFRMEASGELTSLLSQWAEAVPTIRFLDICVVGTVKAPAAVLEKDRVKAARVAWLRERDRQQHGFSYLLALMEKVSDTRGTLSDQELEGQILGDVAALRSFFAHARVIEGDDFLLDYARQLRRMPNELGRSGYLALLRAANDRLELRNPVAPPRRLAKLREVAAAADALGIPRHHPVVLVAAACVYRNRSAIKVMKFRADPAGYDAENVLADIMVMPRLAARKLQLEQEGREGTGPYLRAEYVTDDDGLGKILDQFEAKAVRFAEANGEHETRTDVTVDLPGLLTELPAANAGGAEELAAIVELLSGAPNAASDGAG